MIVKHDPTFFTGQGLGYFKDGDTVRLTLPGGRQVNVTAKPEGLFFAPERSTGHRLILRHCGLLE